jgi:hypothetical protein
MTNRMRMGMAMWIYGIKIMDCRVWWGECQDR